MSVLELKNVHKSYTAGTPVLKGINFTLERKQCLGLVGESGCGKSTLARCVLQLEQVSHGEILFEGTPLHNKTERQIRPYRRQLQTVLQNPASSLNPKLNIRQSLMEPYRQYGERASFKQFDGTSE